MAFKIFSLAIILALFVISVSSNALEQRYVAFIDSCDKQYEIHSICESKCWDNCGITGASIRQCKMTCVEGCQCRSIFEKYGPKCALPINCVISNSFNRFPDTRFF